MHAADAWAIDAGFDEIGSDNVRVDDAVSVGFEPTEQLQFFRKPLDPRTSAIPARM